MKKQKSILLINLIIFTSLLLTGFAEADARVSFYRPDNVEVSFKDCPVIDGSINCIVNCPATIAACCNMQGQYYIKWTSNEGGGTRDCRPNTFCSSEDVGTMFVNAQYVEWDTSTYCTSTCSPTGKRWVWDATASQCCGNDVTDNPDWSQVSCEKCPMNPADVNNTPRKWNVGSGEVALTTCCGDDSGEFYQWTGNGRSCDGTQACCDNANDYARAGNCVTACPDVTAAYFNDMAGNAFNPPTYIPDINDYVMMIADLQGVDDTTTINFVIQGNIGGTKCYSLTLADMSWAQSNKATLETQIKLCDDNNKPDSINFTAYIKSTPSIFKESSSLAVDSVEENSPPVAVISQPSQGDVIPVSQDINFVSGSYDIDDDINSYLWDFDLLEFGGASKGTSSFPTDTVSYSGGGPRLISLIVTDRRGLIAQDKIGVLIDDAAQNDPPLAFILKPKFGEKFSGLLVDFDATASRDDIKVGITDLIFTWTFDDGYVYTGKGLTGAKFTRLFSTAGEHTVSLKVDDADPVSEVQTTFYIEGCQVPLQGGDYEFIPFGTCSALSMRYFCENETTYYDTMNEHCEGLDKNPLTVDDCCPRGYYCKDGGPAPLGACQVRPSDCSALSDPDDCKNLGCVWLDTFCADPANLSSCSDYPSQSSCQGDVLGLGLAGRRGLGTEVCGRTIGNYTIPASSCKCTWDAASGTCKLYYESNATLGGTGFINCIKNFSSLSTCLQGKQLLTWKAQCIPVSGNPADCLTSDAIQQCSDGQKEIKCATAVSKLNFFNFFNLLAVLILLTFYYYFKEARLKHKGH